jgi:hypothetical protein
MLTLVTSVPARMLNALVREYLAIGRSLRTGEIRVLAAYYRYLSEWAELVKKGNRPGIYWVNESMAVLQRLTGLSYAALIGRHERSLIEKGLVRAESSSRRSTAISRAAEPRLRSHDWSNLATFSRTGLNRPVPAALQTVRPFFCRLPKFAVRKCEQPSGRAGRHEDLLLKVTMLVG